MVARGYSLIARGYILIGIVSSKDDQRKITNNGFGYIPTAPNTQTEIVWMELFFGLCLHLGIEGMTGAQGPIQVCWRMVPKLKLAKLPEIT